MSRIHRAKEVAPAPAPRRRGGATTKFAAAAALLVAAALAYRFFGDAGSELRLGATAGATIVVGPESVRVGSKGDVLRPGETVVTLGGDHARVDFGGERFVELSPLSALRLDSGDDASLGIGRALVSGNDPAARPLRVRVGGTETVVISGAEGAIRADGVDPLGPGDAFYLWNVSSPLADLAIRDTIARVEIATLKGELRITGVPSDGAAIRREAAPAAPTPSETAVVVAAGRSYRRRTGPPAPDVLPSHRLLAPSNRNGEFPAAPLASVIANATGPEEILLAIESALVSADRSADAADSLVFVAPSRAARPLALALETPGIDGLVRLACASALARLDRASDALRADRDRAIAVLASTPEPEPLSRDASPRDISNTALAAASLRRALDAADPASDAAIVAVSPAGSGEDAAAAADRLRRHVLRAEIRSAAFLLDDGLVPWLGSILGDADEDPALRAEAAIALGRIGSKSGTEHLLRVLAADEGAPAVVRSGALFALAVYRDPAAIPELVRALLASNSLAERRLAAGALRQYPGDADSAAALAAVAGDPAADESLVAETLNAASERREPWSVPVIAAALADPRARVAEAAVDAATAHPDPSHVAPLEARLAASEADPAARRAVVRALGVVGGAATEAAIRRAMADAERSVRLEAMAAAAFVPSPAMEALLVETLRGAGAEGDGAMTETVIAALSQRAIASADPDALVAALRPFLDRTDPADRTQRRAAAQAIARAGGDGATEALSPLLANEDAELAAIAAAFRMASGDRETFETYRGVATRSADPAARAHALLAIADGVEPGGPLAAEALRFAVERLEGIFEEPLDAFLTLLVFDRLAPADGIEPSVRAAIEPLTASFDPWLACAALTAVAARSDEPRLRALFVEEMTPWTPAARLRDGAESDADLVAECRRAFAERPLFADAAALAAGSRHDLRGGVETQDLAGLRASLEAFSRRQDRLESALVGRLVTSPSPEDRAAAARSLGALASSELVASEIRRAAAEDESPAVRAAAAAALRRAGTAVAGAPAIERLTERITNLLNEPTSAGIAPKADRPTITKE